MTYTVSSGTLNPSIPYHTIGHAMLSGKTRYFLDVQRKWCVIHIVDLSDM